MPKLKLDSTNIASLDLLDDAKLRFERLTMLVLYNMPLKGILLILGLCICLTSTGSFASEAQAKLQVSANVIDDCTLILPAMALYKGHPKKAKDKHPHVVCSGDTDYQLQQEETLLKVSTTSEKRLKPFTITSSTSSITVDF